MAVDYVSPYTDQPDEVPDVSILYRRILLPDWVDWSVRNEANQPRIRSMAFQDWSAAMVEKIGLPGPAMSVGIASILVEHGHDAIRMLGGRAGYAVAGLTAADARAVQQGITLNPTDDEPWHALVFCLHRKSKNEPMKDALAAKAFWVLAPDPPDDADGATGNGGRAAPG